MKLITLRPEQIEARDAVLAALDEDVRRPLIVMPTGSGKSVVIGGLAQALLDQGMRPLVLAHRHELVAQNAEAIRGLNPLASLGICDAQSGRDEREAAVVVASIATIYRRLDQLPLFKAVILDEAHLLPPREGAMIRQIMRRLAFCAGGIEPPLIGLTATPCRTDTGSLIGPELFEKVVFERSLGAMIEAGQLCRVCSRAPKAGTIDTAGLHVGGNILRHGPIDDVRLRASTGGDDRSAPMARVCPQCDEVNMPGAKMCTRCGFDFKTADRPVVIDAVESHEPVLVGANGLWWRRALVVRLSARVHYKPNSPPSLRMLFHLDDGMVVSDFWTFEHPSSWARQKACRRWQQLARHPGAPVPRTAQEAMSRFSNGEVLMPAAIVVERRKRWWEVTEFIMRSGAATEYVASPNSCHGRDAA